MTDKDSDQDMLPSINTKKLSFFFNVFIKSFPELCTFDTYREKEYARIKTGDGYASDLDVYNRPIAKHCKVKRGSNVAALTFLSHTKKYSTSLPYAGKTNKTPHPNKSHSTGNLKILENLEYNFHSNKKYRDKFTGEIEWQEDGVLKEEKNQELDQYLYDRISSPTKAGINDVILITGNVGCGKSTLLSNSLHRVTIDQSLTMTQRPSGYTGRVEQVMIDFEDMPLPNQDEKDNYFDKIINEFLTIRIKEHLKVKGSKFKDVINKVPKTSILVLSFDNLDSLYQKYCEHLILENEPSDNQVELSYYYPFLYKLIHAFTVGEYCNLGIRCVFAARNETIELLHDGQSLDDGGISPLNAINYKIRLNVSTGDQIRRVIQKRIDLIIDTITDDSIKDCLSKNRGNLLGGDAFEKINILSIQGLRHTMSVCKSLSWALLDDGVIFKRYFSEKFATKVFHYLGGKTHYSQANQGITNIFLVSNVYRKAIVSNSNSQNRLKYEVIENHLHTYWLKYFILMYIFHSNVTKDNVINLFTDSGKRGYEKELVKWVLYSLTEIQHGRLIRPKIHFGSGVNLTCSGFECTERGKYLIKDDIFWSFCYLSVVIEDEWLEFPFFLRKSFSNPVGFAFLFYTDHKEYNKKYLEYMINKSEKVLTFLDILDVSLKYEKKNILKYLKV